MPIVVTIDQRRSRKVQPQAGTLVSRLNATMPREPALRFEVTVGDELQGVLIHADELPRVIRAVLREGEWWIGVGVGDVEPGASPRQSTGAAFFAARAAVDRAKKNPSGIAVEPRMPEEPPLLEAALVLWTALLRTRTTRGWEAAELRYRDLSEHEVATRLGITQQAVHQRLRAAFFAEDEQGAELITSLARASLRDLAR